MLRWDYGNPVTGTCTETVEGGNHVRYWIQNGPQADSGAIFIAASYEMPIEGELSYCKQRESTNNICLEDGHNIVPNG